MSGPRDDVDETPDPTALEQLAEALNQDAPPVADLPFSLTAPIATGKGVQCAFPWEK